MQKNEENMETRIRNLKKKINKMRMQNQRQQPQAKRRKVEGGVMAVERPRGIDKRAQVKMKIRTPNPTTDGEMTSETI